MNSKGLTPVALNWIFVLIAGGVILIFFFNIMTTQMQISETEMSGRVLRDVETILIGRGVSEGVDSFIPLPKKTVTFSCEDPCTPETGCFSGFGLKGSSFWYDTATQPIFTREEHKADHAYGFALTWNVPFPVQNFLYLASPDQRIIFNEGDCQSSSSYCREVYNLIPDRLKEAGIVRTGIFDAAAFPASKLTFVGFGASCSGFMGLTPGSSELICVDVNTQKLNFYDSDGGPTSELSYLGGESILGAIFSEGSDMYSCNMQKAFYRLSHAGVMIEEKRVWLDDHYTNSGFPTEYCKDSGLLGNTGLFSPFVNAQWDSAIPSEFSVVNVVSDVDEVERVNREIQRRSCAALY